ncbi:alpha/beta fold hydrolase [Agromyces sp. H3Y2-19a]|uniref:alpha/beta fold hydrolase n=1 Tax=Agromyces chromiiresistens TaxID=3030835 RepID=UPI0023B9A6D4|nr:alpha/beta fold hydrolase [Agromyces chromiiresistens]MDF0513365.1 alpha/beta fold hydrolase [Agromyces chromiiresistens]
MVGARIVLVHGIRTSATMWRRQVAALTAHGVDVVAVDLPGHGSRMAEEFSIDAAMAVIEEALNAPQTDGTAPDAAPPRLLVGLSLGGYLSIEFAARHPDRLDGLVAAACGTVPRGPGLAAYRSIAAAIARLPDRGRWLNDATAALFLAPDALADVVAGGVALDVMAPALAAVGHLDPVAALDAVRVPIWFVNGRYDHFRLQERRLLRAAHDARLVVVPGATHLVSLTAADGFTAVVLGAVAELERRAAARHR